MADDELLAEPEAILKLDMNRCSVADLERISANYEFKIQKGGTFHGFGSWFTVDFPGGTTLDTGPGKPLTHWKQDLFGSIDPYDVQPGDRIEGTITIERNPYWRRHCHVTLSYNLYRKEQDPVPVTTMFKLWR